MKKFDLQDWSARCVCALEALEEVQTKILNDHWQRNGFPPRRYFNGLNETPFPLDDYINLYDSALGSWHVSERQYLQQVSEKLGAVRGVLRCHPTYSYVFKTELGHEKLQVAVDGTQFYSQFTWMIAGLMARRAELKTETFEIPVSELCELLAQDTDQAPVDLQSNIRQGWHIELFCGAKIRQLVEIGQGYVVGPLGEFWDFVEPSWFQSRAPEQFENRDYSSFFAVAYPFHWTPKFGGVQAKFAKAESQSAPLLFQRVAVEFSNLLSVVSEQPIEHVYSFPSVRSRASHQLLGQIQSPSSARAGSFVGDYFDPFSQTVFLEDSVLSQTIEYFSARRFSRYAELAHLLHRLAQSQRTFGPFAKEDRILDLAIIFERYFPEKKTYGAVLAERISEKLAKSVEEAENISKDISHFYRMRNALVHGAKSSNDEELLLEIDQALENGFRIARQLLINSIAEIEPSVCPS